MKMTEDDINRITIKAMESFGFDDLTWVYEAKKEEDFVTIVAQLGALGGIMEMRGQMLEEIENEKG